MRELDFINGQSPVPDAAITEFVDMFGEDLPEQAIEAIRAAAKMGNKKLSKALAAMAAEWGRSRWRSHDGAHALYDYSSSSRCHIWQVRSHL